MWHRGEQACITMLHCTCRTVHVSLWIAKSTSTGEQEFWSALSGGGWAGKDHAQYREYVDTGWMLGEHCAMRVRHWLPWCWYYWAFNICCDPSRGVACQAGHNLQVRSLNTCTTNRYLTRDYVCRYSEGNLHHTLLKPVCNNWNCHLNRVHCNTWARHRDFVSL